MEGVIFPCSLNTDGIFGRSTLHTNLNPFAPSFVYCVKKLHQTLKRHIMKEQNSANTNSASYTMKLSNATLNESRDITNIYSPKILQYADLTTIFKILECVLKEN